MRNNINQRLNIPISLFLLIFISGFQVKTVAQITVYQYRHVPDDKIEEFLKRETTYWSKVAQKAIDNKTMTFWAVFEKVGGYDLPNSSNYLFVNTYPDIDKAGDAWANAEATAGVKMDQMETNSISTTTSQFFVMDKNWMQDAKAVPEKDFNFLKMIYHNSEYADSLVGLEKKYWGPFIKKSMDNNLTSQVAWGNAIVLSPSGDNIKFNSISYDLYTNLQDALLEKWDPKTVFPNKGLAQIGKLEINRRGTAIYRIVKVVAAN